VWLEGERGGWMDEGGVDEEGMCIGLNGSWGGGRRVLWLNLIMCSHLGHRSRF
jgi:hypothetical protein